MPDQNTVNYHFRFNEYAHDPPYKAHQGTAFSLSHGGRVACLWLLHNVETAAVYGLVLTSPDERLRKRSIPESNAGHDVFERVGLITPVSEGYQKDLVPALSWFTGSTAEETTCVTII